MGSESNFREALNLQGWVGAVTVRALVLAALGALPTRDSVFMTSLARRAGAEGGYLISKGKPKRILKAMIGAFSVSPD